MSAKNLIFSSAGNVEVNPNAWDISYAVYDAGTDAGDISKAFYPNSFLSMQAQDLNPVAIYIKPDGLSLYTLMAGRVWQYTMSTPWYVSNATYASKNILINSQTTSAQGLFFKDDGTKMYMLGEGGLGQAVYQYSLSTAWDVSTASYDSVSFSVAAQDDTPRGLFFKPDGTKMYILGATGDDVNEYSLSSGWDISTSSYVQNFSISAQDTTPSGISFLSDGTKMYISGQAGDDINQYNLSTPWDISTASYVQNFSVSGQTISPTDIFFKPDGSVFFVVADKDPSNNSVSWVITYPIGAFGLVLQTSPQGIFFKPDGLKMYVVDSQYDNVKEYNLSTAWDIRTASVSAAKSVSAQELTPSDVFFKSDGTKMYVLGTTGDDVNEYALSTPWDVSTASYTINFSVNSQETVPNGFFFKPDGTKMFVVGQTNDTVYQYSLSSAWDISTASYDSISFSVASQETTPRGIIFKPDGSKMYIVGSVGDDINEYNLATLWDITSASFVQNFAVYSIAPSDIYFRSNGEEFFVIDSTNYKVLKYTISST